MLEELYPKLHRRYARLPIFGSVLDSFAEFLVRLGYPRGPVRRHVRAAGHVDRRLQALGCSALIDVRRELLLACVPSPGRPYLQVALASTVRLLQRFLEERGGLVPIVRPETADPTLSGYALYLRQTRGLSDRTVGYHLATAREFCLYLDANTSTGCDAITPEVLEDVLVVAARRLCRATMQHVASHLRSFLRFLAIRGVTRPGLDAFIDTPRVYRGEKLPRSLPWETVRAFLRAIDRSTPMGRRDYAMFLLISTYGLRSSDVVSLRLDDIEWRAGRLCIAQRKTAQPLWLPLTDAVGQSLLEYLRDGRPSVPFREVFVRHRAPTGLLKPTAVAEAFQGWSRRSGLAIPFNGAHCLRHSYAVHLLRRGTPMKTIGDLLGHRDAESTCIYLRLSVDDLRDVALALPPCSAAEVLA